MKQLSLLEKSGAVLTVLVVAIIVAVVGGYWWSNTTPFRPKGVPSTAVFLRAPATGAPGAPQGEWLACTEREGHNYCRLTDKSGRTEFEGEFIRSHGSNAVPDDQLRINALATSKDESVWLSDTWVPLVHLENGEILIPASKYDEGKRLLNQQRNQ